MKKIKLILSGLGIIIIFLSFFLLNIYDKSVFMPLILNAEEVMVLSFENEVFKLPIYVQIAGYDYQADKVYIEKNGTFLIEDSNFDLTYLNKITQRYNEIEQDSFHNHGHEALPSTFFILATEPFVGDKNGFIDKTPTISGMRSLDNVVSLPIPETEIWGKISYGTFSFKKVDITDTMSPVIEGYDGTITTDVHSPITLDEIKGYLRAKDEIDGDLTKKITIEYDGYSDNKEIIGTYSIVFSVKDQSGNKAELTIYVEVLDLDSPIINGPETIDTYISNPLSTDEILQQYTSTDRYDGNITDNIKIIRNTFETIDKNKPSKSEIILKVEDSSGNKTTKKIVINLIDDVKPLISGDATYTKCYDVTLTIDQILSNLTAYDNVDGNISDKILVLEDNYSENPTKLGTYTISTCVKDEANNTSNIFVITVNIKDLNNPIFYVDETIISVHTFDNLTIDMVENYLLQKGKINRNYKYNLEIVTNEYEVNKTIPGIYKYVVNVEYENKAKETIALSIFVNDNYKEFVYDNYTTDFFSSISIFFTNAWNSLTSFLSSCWIFLLDNIFLPIASLFN